MEAVRTASDAATLRGGRADRTARGSGRQWLVILAVSLALMVGHLASLLAAAPAWYSAIVAVATAAGLGWVTWTLLGFLRTRREVVIVRGAAAPQPRPRHGDIIEAEMVEDTVDAVDEGFKSARVVSIIREVPVRKVTGRELTAAGPAGAERTMGPTYVAANLADYVGRGTGTSIARAHRRAAGTHQRPARRASPEAALRVAQVRAAYSLDVRPGTREFRA